eukprot:4506869-Alexandrium_andersonii.AAC.1
MEVPLVARAADVDPRLAPGACLFLPVVLPLYSEGAPVAARPNRALAATVATDPEACPCSLRAEEA